MPAIDLTALADIFEIVEGTALIISLLFVWFQIREGNRLSRIENYHKTFQIASPLMLQLVQDRGLAELRLRGIRDYASLDDVDKHRYFQLLFWWLVVYDDIYYQYQNKLMDGIVYRGWDIDLQKFVRDHRLESFWESELKPLFRPDFQQIVEQKLHSS